MMKACTVNDLIEISVLKNFFWLQLALVNGIYLL